MQRRRFLHFAASAGALSAVAGCTRSPGQNNSSDDGPGAGGDETTFEGTSNDQETTAETTENTTIGGTTTDEGTPLGEGTETGSPGTPPAPAERTGTIDGVDYQITVTGAECASGSRVNEVGEIDFDEDASELVVAGTIDAATPCKTVDVSAIDHDEGEGSVTVTIATADRADGPDMCQQCLGALDYEATLTFGDEFPSNASVVHDGRSGRQSMASAAYGSASASAPTTTDG
jgi:hypothetical protein